MSNDSAIRVNGLGKKYRIAHETAPYKTLGETITRAVKAPFLRFSGKTRTRSTEEFWALKDVSFEVKKGEVIGIIGRNGAGKSTLLKILSRITTPAKGTVEVHGRIGSLLEVGTGFHPELSGRENIFLSGSIMGMKKAEIEEKFNQIVEFAEIEQFLDTPVKRYSSGMYVRLAFAVAAHLEPEILIVDEVLAVGDAAFQKKCLGKMGEVAKEGRTVLFVSHNMAAVKALCTRGILLEEGKIRFDGEASDAIDLYLNKISHEISRVPLSERKRDKPVSLQVKILGLEIASENTNNINTLDSTKPLEIHLIIQVFKKTTCACQIQIRDLNRTILHFSSELQQNKIFDFEMGTHTIVCKIDPPFLTSGDYWITCGLANGPHEWIDYIFDAGKFSVKELDEYQNGFNLTQNIALFHVDHSWETQL